MIFGMSSGADMKLRDAWGDTALDYAERFNHWNVARSLTISGD